MSAIGRLGDSSNTEKVPGFGWANYVKGVFHFIQEHLGEKIDGLDCTFMGSIPMGAGLSGGGFGGSAIVMVRADQAQTLSEKIVARCSPHGIHPEILAVLPSAGAHIIL